MYQIGILDDEDRYLKQMETILTKVMPLPENQYRIECFNRAENLLQAVRQQPFELLFLDILMNGMDGMDLAKVLRQEGYAGTIVFVTSSPEYAMAGYEVEAAQYLLKPVDEKKIAEIVAKQMSRYQEPKSLTLTGSGGRIQKIKIDEIRYLEVYHRTLIFYCNEEKIEWTGTLDGIEESLPDYFYRCHRSYLVNMNYVTGIVRYEYMLTTGERVPVAKNKYNEAKEKLIRSLS
ncbi:MAG: LytTR family DNA-binding domain-containing protein [Clostridiales bacterium]|nr:LytTR family DNA-binding domain-containing protein [Clostridiales bacterium]